MYVPYVVYVPYNVVPYGGINFLRDIRYPVYCALWLLFVKGTNVLEHDCLCDGCSFATVTRPSHRLHKNRDTVRPYVQKMFCSAIT